MRKTLLQILNDIGAEVDQDTTQPSGTDLAVRVNLVQQALEEWANSYTWAQLRQAGALTFAFSGTSFGLPVNFNGFQSSIFDVASTGNDEYPIIRPDERFTKGTSDKYAVVGGDGANGFFVMIHPAMASSASLTFDYQAAPSSMATLADVSVCPNNTFLVKKVISRIFRSRSDTRFPQVEADADYAMQQMLEDEMTSHNGSANTLRSWTTTSNFRIGG